MAHFRRHTPQPQRVVISQQMRYGLLHQTDVELLSKLEEVRLIEVVRLGQLLFKKPVMDGRQADRAGGFSLFDRRFGNRTGYGRKLGDGLMLEDLLGGKAKPRLTGFRDDLNAEYRVSAQLKEVVMDAELVELQHVGPY